MFEATHPIKALGFIAVLIMAIAIACGSDSDTPASTGQDSAPTAKAVAPAATIAPEPTATTAPAPTATKAPAPTAKPEETKRPGVIFKSDYDSAGLVAIELPSALEKGAEPLSKVEVESLWTETIMNARHFVSDGSIVIDTCADGTGVYLVDQTLAGETFTWEVKQDPGGTWRVAAARLEFTNTELGYGWAAGNRIPLEINPNGEREWGTSQNRWRCTRSSALTADVQVRWSGLHWRVVQAWSGPRLRRSPGLRPRSVLGHVHPESLHKTNKTGRFADSNDVCIAASFFFSQIKCDLSGCTPQKSHESLANDDKFLPHLVCGPTGSRRPPQSPHKRLPVTARRMYLG
jgi:hypothetical protein